MNRHPSRKRHQGGFALITVMLLLAVLAVMVTAYFMLTQIEMTTAASSQNSTSGFYAAEAGLNIRGQELRNTFVGFEQPGGLSPRNDRNEEIRACQAFSEDGAVVENEGEGHFACAFHDNITATRSVVTYVTEPGATPGTPQEPQTTRLTAGLFQGLNAQEFVYDVHSESYRVGEDLPEAKLQTTFRSQVVPLFQFAAFYDQDLEIAPGADMTLEGRVHSNGDLFMTGNPLNINGNVTSAGRIYGGSKVGRGCDEDFAVWGESISCSNGEIDNETPGYTESELEAVWQSNEVKQGVNQVQVPEPEFLDRDPENEQKEDYWEKADLRVVLKAYKVGTSTLHLPEVQDVKGNKMTGATSLIRGGCANETIGTSDTFFNNREGKDIRMLEVDMDALLTCIDQHSGATEFDIDGGLRNDSNGGLVFHFSVDDSALGNESKEKSGSNNYGVRVKNGAVLNQKIEGLTVATNQAMYVQGDYNADDRKKKPASFLADSLNILSNDWKDLTDSEGNECSSRRKNKCFDAEGRNLAKTRKASDTTINAAFLAGVDKSDAEKNKYNGGLENYPRMHENWSGRDLNLLGSFVSLGEPKHVKGGWKYGNPQYTAPSRNWNYDTDFNNAANLPPLSPRFVNLVQQLFTRSFESDDWQLTNPDLSQEQTTPNSY